MKTNMGYSRFRRTSLDRVDTEMMLSCLGYNLRKFMRFIEGKARFTYWNAPAGTGNGHFKKPSAKRLRNSIARRREKQPNEIARDSYKRNRTHK